MQNCEFRPYKQMERWNYFITLSDMLGPANPWNHISLILLGYSDSDYRP